MAMPHQRAAATPEKAEDTDAHGLVDKLISAVKHVHEEHVHREHMREEHMVEDIQHLAEHNPEMDRENMPF